MSENKKLTTSVGNPSRDAQNVLMASPSVTAKLFHEGA